MLNEKKKKSYITLFGDYYLSSQYPKNEFKNILKILKSNNFNVLNYEGCFGTPFPKGKPLIMSEDSLNLPSNVLISLSNNHVFDAGQSGFSMLKQKLDTKNLKSFGIETRKNNNDNFRVVTINERKVCFAGFGWKNEECLSSTKNTSGVKNLTKKNIINFFKSIEKVEFDFLVFYFHCGYEFEYYPLPLHVNLARLSIELGVDLIFSSHTHCIQPYEIYKGKYIFYGLGNFYFSNDRDFYPEMSDEGLIVHISLQNNLLVPSHIQKIIFSRNENGFHIKDDFEFINDNKLELVSLEQYDKDYKRLRTRKKNPRPIMKSNSILMNSVKYYIWLAIVKILGFLRLRQVIKKILGW